MQWLTLDEFFAHAGIGFRSLTPEDATSLVEEGLITRELAVKLVQQRRFEDEYRRRINADLDRYFNRRLEELQQARRERPHTKTRIENDGTTQELYRAAEKLKRENPRRTWEQIAARIGISRSQLFRWRARLRENATIRD